MEITTGDRGDPRDRLLTVRDIETAGMATITVRNKYATLTGGVTSTSVASLIADGGDGGDFARLSIPTLEVLDQAAVEDAQDFLVYHNGVARVQRLPYQTLRALFLTQASDAEIDGNWAFTNEDLALEVRAEVPRFRWHETAAPDETLDADSAIWDWTVDGDVMSLSLISDDEQSAASFLELGREGMDPAFLALMNGAVLQLQDGTLAEPGLTFDADIDTGLYRIGANRIGVSAGAALALDIIGTQVLVPLGTAGVPGLAFHGDADTGPFRPGANEYAISANGVERLRVNSSGIQVAGTAVLTALTGHLDTTPSSAANYAVLKVRNNAGTEIWRLTSETDGDLDFQRQSGSGELSLNAVRLIDAALFTAGTLDDARLSVNVVLKDAVQTLTNKTIDTANNAITVDQADVTGLLAALALKLDASAYTAADVLAKLLTVDGAGSGLDADLLDGVSSAAFALLSGATFTGNVSIADAAPRLILNDTNAGADAKIFDLFADGGALSLRTRTDADGTGFTLLNVPRTASTTPDRVFIGDDITVLGLSAVSGNANNYPWLFTRGNNSPDVRVGIANTGTGGWHVLRYATSMSSPTQATLGLALGENSFSGYNTDLAAISRTVRIRAQTIEAWTASTSATQLDFLTTPTGSHSPGINMTLNGTQTLVTTGTAALPAYSFVSDPNTGLYRVGSDNIGLSVNATNVLDLNATTLNLVAATETPTVSIGAFTGSGLTAAQGFTLIGTSTTFMRILGRAASAAFLAYRVNGTSAAPTAVANANAIFSFSAGGATDTTPTLGFGASFQMLATETWSGSGRGCKINFNSTAAGTTTLLTTCAFNGTQALYLDGTVSLPSISLQNDPDCGMYRIGANQLGIATNGTLVLDIATGLFAITATTVRFNTTTAATIGAAGGAAALPATPLGYITTNVNGTAVKIPYYNV